MTIHPHTRFELPDALNATEPPEARGLARDQVKLLVAEGSTVTHTRFDKIGQHLRPGDLLLVNTSATLPAAVDGTWITGAGVAPVVVHFSTALDDGNWVVELRNGGTPMLGGTSGDQVELPRGILTLLAPYQRDSTRLWIAKPPVRDVVGYLQRHGRPITYSYVNRRWPLASYQTVFSRDPGSVEMPSAGRPFSFELVSQLAAQGVLIAPITLHCGVSSLESHEPPLPERYDVPAHTARLVNWVRANGGRVVAVGTTAVRAIESAVTDDGSVVAARGWTDLVLGPDHQVRVVDGLVTGMHAPEASHLLLLESVVGGETVQRAYDAALQQGYLWHEFGDTSLLLR
ncbi:S-adenosylmethionine:tRNA ribosyltransferase-isomerase [Kribbella sandramycini]|uniref:S-adenosylmethionine:tRNA ribosyltransferase-isomerase n=1 Tax=Kribbella sandramycini TaxID=60450 RepID=A0A7Y4L1Q9_9ACTN|nr:S-adenosylmethionine:tRNA ribosyltransferase-isomerase [Kribbella sandramycini]MBB6565582.1 S-adenosylmethionine:tRNA ribosyltransferase-isomerase [Kribbella sandramycini]NOL41846.1 S-adenosylmethionine:tRNA ribosyltransferase-isomerase [Kribbella sandramycini]